MKAEKRFAELRKQAGLSQQALADRIYVTRQAVSQWETGDRVPNSDNLMYLSKLYGVSVDYLLGNADKPTGGASADISPEIAPTEKEQPAAEGKQRGRIRRYIAAAVVVVLAVLLIVYILKRDITLPASKETQSGELSTEDVSSQEIGTFEFEW